MVTGRCHCGAVRYELSGDVAHHALCHCTDCRRASGAPLVGWIAVASDALDIRGGAPKVYHSSEGVERHFCGDCGTGLFYYNEAVLPGLVDVQSATLDDPEVAPPQAHIQTAERIGWMEGAHELPAFARYPPQG